MISDLSGGKLLFPGPYSLEITTGIARRCQLTADALEATTQLLEFVHWSFGVGDDGQKVQLLQDLGSPSWAPRRWPR